jgi:hypothetical protein
MVHLFFMRHMPTPLSLSRRGCQRRPQLISLLEAIANERGDLSLNGFDDGIVAWAIQSGLGPSFYRAVKDDPNNSACPAWYALKAADLTARVVVGDHLDAMEEILDACRGQVPPITLLKGVSIAEECYPEPHLRLMRDLDFLIQKESLPKVTGALEQLGYRQQWDGPAKQYETHHHAAPFYHEEKEVWVEVHHALLSPRRQASKARIFQPENLRMQLRLSDFRGRQVRRLSSELQLVYLATHWAQDFQRVGGMVAVVDTIYLLKHAQHELCWQRIVDSVRGSVAGSYLYLLLSYMYRYGLVRLAPEILHELFANQPSFGKMSLKAAHAIIDRYYVAGKPAGRLLNKGVTILWKTLTLAGPASQSLMHAPLDLSLPDRSRFH